MVTGIAGFVGYHLATALADAGFEVTGVDSLTDYYPVSLKKFRLRNLESEYQVRNFCINLSNKKHAEKLFQQICPDVVVHLAAQPGVRLPVEKYSYYVENNLLAFFNVANLALRNSCKSFLYASSSSVYGNTGNSVLDEENTYTKPISFYGSTKLSNEILADTLFSNSSTKALGLRFFTVYGPGQRPDLAIHKFTDSIYRGKSIPQFGDGSTRRDYTYVDDIVQGVLGALRYEGPKFDIFNLGENQTTTLSELIIEIEKALGKKAIIERLPEQQGDMPLTAADITKARSLLGYNPQTKIREGIPKFVEWYLSRQ